MGGVETGDSSTRLAFGGFGAIPGVHLALDRLVIRGGLGVLTPPPASIGCVLLGVSLAPGGVPRPLGRRTRGHQKNQSFTDLDSSLIGHGPEGSSPPNHSSSHREIQLDMMNPPTRSIRQL